MQIMTYADFLTLLLIIAAVMLIIVLYHLMFAAANLRKISKKVDVVTDHLEEVLLKPLKAMEQGMDWVGEFFKSKTHQHKKKHKSTEVEIEVE